MKHHDVPYKYSNSCELASSQKRSDSANQNLRSGQEQRDHHVLRKLLRLPVSVLVVTITTSSPLFTSLTSTPVAHCVADEGGEEITKPSRPTKKTLSSPRSRLVHQITNNERVVTSLVAGAIAGAIAKTTIAPLDRTKIFFQTTPESQFSARQVIRYLYQTYNSTGFTSLWRGNSATMARIIPYAAIQFTAHEQWKHVLRVEKQGSGSTAELTRFVCGALAGVTAQGLTYPLDLTRARLAVSPVSKYTSLKDVFVKTVKGEGVAGLFKGFVPTMLGVIPYAGCSFYCYEGLKRLWVGKFGERSVGGFERLTFGAVAGVVGQSASYPFDIVRRRLQTGVLGLERPGTGTTNGVRRLNGAETRNSHVFRLMAHIARTEGVVGGLYKGLSMNWVKGPVAAGISFACYDWIQLVLRDKLLTHHQSEDDDAGDR